MESDTPVTLFSEVKMTFFPRWDRDGRWTLQVVPSIAGGADGICHFATKTIDICEHFVIQGGDVLRCVLIHEITHGVTSSGHGRKWQQRYAKVSDKAREIGQTELAAMIDKELISYREPHIEPMTAATVSSEIHEILSERPDLSFTQVVGHVADHWGFTPDEVLQRYPALEKTYHNVNKKVNKELQNMRTLQSRTQK